MKRIKIINHVFLEVSTIEGGKLESSVFWEIINEMGNEVVHFPSPGNEMQRNMV